MLYKTKGIVLNYIKFKDTSIIVRIYTEKFGLQSYIVNGIRSLKSKKSIGLFQPLTLLDMVVYHKANHQISRISEYKMANPYHSIPFDIKKSTIAIFLTDFLLNVLKEEEDQQEQFDFIYNSMLILDQLEKNYQDFHLLFIIKLSKYLGVGISSIESLYENAGLRSSSQLTDQFIKQLLSVSYQNDLKANGQIRKETLELFISYFKEQYDQWHELKSLKVLGEIFH